MRSQINLTEDIPKKLNAKAYTMTIKENDSTKSIVGQITQGRIDCKIEFKIYSTMFLYPKEQQITTRLQKVKLVYNKRQDTTILNQGSG